MIQQRRVESFTELLDTSFEVALDGGAGSGSTARQMISAGVSHVHAFEPFKGNHRFFDDNPAITLHKTALGSKRGKANFYVSSTVKTGTPGWEGHEGYSSVGMLRRRTPLQWLKPGFFSKVPVVRADDVVERADFIKLDLQGGEADAFSGMQRLLSGARMLWVELISDMRILDAIERAGFEVFSTPLLLYDYHTIEGVDVFKESPSSTGLTYLHAWKREPWRDFRSEFTAMKSKGLIQTDILALR